MSPDVQDAMESTNSNAMRRGDEGSKINESDQMEPIVFDQANSKWPLGVELPRQSSTDARKQRDSQGRESHQTSPSTQSSKRTGNTSQSVLDDYKDLIKQLYVEEDRSLDDVMQIIQAETTQALS